VAYELNLLAGSLIHLIFHVSQLKRKVGPMTRVHSKLPVLGSEGRLKVEPLAILNRRLIKKNNQAVVEALIQWANMTPEDATWECYGQLLKQFPNNCLEDKTGFKKEAMAQGGQVSEIELVKPAELKETGPKVKETGQNCVNKEEAQLVTILDNGNGEVVGDKGS
jgi:hypothetical protein